MKRLLFLVCFIVFPSMAGQTAAQSSVRPVRELPAWLVYSYHYGVSPAITLAAFLAEGGCDAAKTAWWIARSLMQDSLDTGKFIYNNPVGACFMIPANIFIAHALYQEGSAAWNYLRNMIHEQAIRIEADVSNRPEAAAKVIDIQEPQPMEVEPREAQTKKRKRNEEPNEEPIVKKQRLN